MGKLFLVIFVSACPGIAAAERHNNGSHGLQEDVNESPRSGATTLATGFKKM